MDHNAGLLFPTLTNDETVNFDEVLGDGCLGSTLPAETNTPVFDIFEGDDGRGRGGDTKKVAKIVCGGMEVTKEIVEKPEDAKGGAKGGQGGEDDDGGDGGRIEGGDEGLSLDVRLEHVHGHGQDNAL